MVLKMRIAISTNLFPPAISGSSSYSFDICKTLITLGHEVFLIVPQRPEGIDYSLCGLDKDHVLLLKSWKVPTTKIMIGFSQMYAAYAQGNAKRVRSFLRDKKIDIVYQQSHIFSTAWLSKRACKKLKIPRAVCHHTLILHDIPLYDWILRTAEKIIIRKFFLSNDDLWICPNDSTAEYCDVRFPGMKKALSNFGILPFPECNDQESKKQADEIAAKHDPIIFSLGHIIHVRHRADLVEALSILRIEYPHIALVLVGDEQVPYPRNKMDELGMKDHIYFMGIKSRDKIRPFLDISLLEAHWFSGVELPCFGVAAMECMASGLCCMSNAEEDCQGPDTFRDNVHYFKVECDNVDSIVETLRKAINNREKCFEMGQAAADLIESRFSWKVVAEDLIRVFDQHISDYNERLVK
jgi:glycosyltransferase involved in cell wall biosynthesis